jgi:hypothetical protein
MDIAMTCCRTWLVSQFGCRNEYVKPNRREPKTPVGCSAICLTSPKLPFSS